MFKLGFILNGRNGRKKHFYNDLKHIRQSLKNIEFNVIETNQTGHASSIASEFITEGYTHLIAVGGDGTLNEVVNGIMKNYKEEIILGVLPYGTANDFVKSIDLPLNLVDLFEAISKENYRKIDLGLIDCSEGKRYFINIADIGIGAEVVKRVNKSKKLLGSYFTFFKAIIETFLVYKNKGITCKTADWEYTGKINSLVIANGKYFGSGLCIAPDAKLDNGQFSIVISGDITLKDYLKNVSKIKKGNLVNHPFVEYKSATNLELTAPQPCGIEADGEFVGYSPATIQVIPKKLNLLIS
jgi:diacylglycerol kinase (ATP)